MEHPPGNEWSTQDPVNMAVWLNYLSSFLPFRLSAKEQESRYILIVYSFALIFVVFYILLT